MKRAFGSVHERSGVFYVRWSQEGRRVKRAVPGSRRDAHRVLDHVRVLVDGGASLASVLVEAFGEKRAAGSTFASLVDPYLDVAEKRKRPSTLRKDRCVLGAIQRDAAWAGEDLARLTTATLERWREELEAAGRKPSTVNRYMAAVGAVLTWAAQSGRLDSNPARGIRALSEARLKRERYLTAEEGAKLLAACEGDYRVYVLAAMETGCRAGELCALRWRDVDLRSRRITVPAAYNKTGTTRTVPLTARMVQALRKLKRQPRLDGKDAVFTLDGEPISESAHRREWGRACRRAGFEDLRYHDLRHSCASWLLAAGVPLATIGKILGHQHAVTTQRYAHLSDDVVQAAMQQLDRARAGG